MPGRSTAVESLRRVYGELVRRRSRVRVVTVDPDHEVRTTPRFLLSPYRSGTTLLRYCLDSHPDLAVPPESDFLTPMMQVLNDGPSLAGLGDMGFSYDDVKDRLGRFARSFFDAYALSKGAELGWLDKSPRYAEEPDMVAGLFQGSRLLVMHRHPLDQVHSFTRGGSFAHDTLATETRGAELIERAARYWATCTSKLTATAESHVERTLVITYEELCRRPRETLASALAHLDLPWSDNVLDYHKFDHDLGREGGRVTGTRGFVRSAGGWTSWPSEWVEIAWSIVGPVASDVGYSITDG